MSLTIVWKFRDGARKQGDGSILKADLVCAACGVGYNEHPTHAPKCERYALGLHREAADSCPHPTQECSDCGPGCGR